MPGRHRVDEGGTTTTCIRCGEAVAPDALRCPHCALTFPALTELGGRGDAAEVIGTTGHPEVTAPPGSGPMAAPVDPGPTPRAGDTAPQPVFTPPAGSAPTSVPWRWLAVVAVVVAAGIGAWLLAGGGGDETASGPPPEPELSLPSFELVDGGLDVVVTVAGPEAGDRLRLLVDGEQVTEAEGPAPVGMRWTGATEGDHRLIVQLRRGAEQTEAVLDITVPPAVPGVEATGRWIMALASFDEPERAERFAADIAGVPDARVLESSDWPSLRPGFWVVYDGPFETGDAVLDRCRELGRDIPNDCVGRVISLDEGDRSLIATE